jgi:hypothetical protein
MVQERKGTAPLPWKGNTTVLGERTSESNNKLGNAGACKKNAAAVRPLSIVRSSCVFRQESKAARPALQSAQTERCMRGLCPTAAKGETVCRRGCGGGGGTSVVVPPIPPTRGRLCLLRVVVVAVAQLPRSVVGWGFRRAPARLFRRRERRLNLWSVTSECLSVVASFDLRIMLSY